MLGPGGPVLYLKKPFPVLGFIKSTLLLFVLMRQPLTSIDRNVFVLSRTDRAAEVPSTSPS